MPPVGTAVTQPGSKLKAGPSHLVPSKGGSSIELVLQKNRPTEPNLEPRTEGIQLDRETPTHIQERESKRQKKNNQNITDCLNVDMTSKTQPHI